MSTDDGWKHPQDMPYASARFRDMQMEIHNAHNHGYTEDNESMEINIGDNSDVSNLQIGDNNVQFIAGVDPVVQSQHWSGIVADPLPTETLRNNLLKPLPYPWIMASYNAQQKRQAVRRQRRVKVWNERARAAGMDKHMHDEFWNFANKVYSGGMRMVACWILACEQEKNRRKKAEKHIAVLKKELEHSKKTIEAVLKASVEQTKDAQSMIEALMTRLHIVENHKTPAGSYITGAHPCLLCRQGSVSERLITKLNEMHKETAKVKIPQPN